MARVTFAPTKLHHVLDSPCCQKPRRSLVVGDVAEVEHFDHPEAALLPEAIRARVPDITH
jgi:hypothetical protein